jgi:uncharacterized protein (TIGR04255 family)
MFTVEPSPSYHLNRAPLAQALAQVRFPTIAVVESLAGIAPLQESIRDRFPYMEQKDTHEVGFLIGPSGPSEPTRASQRMWEFSDDGGHRLVVQPDRASLTVGESYSGIESFAEVFGRVLESLSSLRIPRCDRLGVRYLSIAEDQPSEPGSWREWFKAELRGLADTAHTTSLRALQTQVQLKMSNEDEFSDFPAALQAVVRHGFAPGGSELPGIPPVTLSTNAFFLDLDFYCAGQQRFDAAAILSQFRKLHAQIDGFFYWALTDAGKDYFQLEFRE